MENAKKNFEISLKICEEIDFKQDFAWNLSNLGNIYGSLGDMQKRLELLEKALVVKENLNNPFQKKANRTCTTIPHEPKIAPEGSN